MFQTISFSLLFLFFIGEAFAEVIQYTDEKGQKHFVDGEAKVPEKFRDQLKSNKALPPISRLKSGREKLYEQESYSQFTQPTVEIFVTSWCPHCRELEKYLAQRKVAFTRYDIESNNSGREKYEAFGGGGVPLIRIGNGILKGFNPNRLEAALQLMK